MVVESRPHDPGAEGVQVSSLSLIDLAGSECLRQRVVEKQRRHVRGPASRAAPPRSLRPRPLGSRAGGPLHQPQPADPGPGHLPPQRAAGGGPRPLPQQQAHAHSEGVPGRQRARGHPVHRDTRVGGVRGDAEHAQIRQEGTPHPPHRPPQRALHRPCPYRAVPAPNRLPAARARAVPQRPQRRPQRARAGGGQGAECRPYAEDVVCAAASRECLAVVSRHTRGEDCCKRGGRDAAAASVCLCREAVHARGELLAHTPAGPLSRGCCCGQCDPGGAWAKCGAVDAAAEPVGVEG